MHEENYRMVFFPTQATARISLLEATKIYIVQNFPRKSGKRRSNNYRMVCSPDLLVPIGYLGMPKN